MFKLRGCCSNLVVVLYLLLIRLTFSKSSVAWMNVWWSIHKNHIENRTSPSLVMVSWKCVFVDSLTEYVSHLKCVKYQWNLKDGVQSRLDTCLDGVCFFFAPLASPPNHTPMIYRCPIKKSNEIAPAYLKTYITVQTVKSLRFTLCFHHVTQSYMEIQQNVNFALKLTLSELTKTLVTSLQIRTFIYYTWMVASLPIWSYPSVEKIK